MKILDIFINIHALPAQQNIYKQGWKSHCRNFYFLKNFQLHVASNFARPVRSCAPLMPAFPHGRADCVDPNSQLLPFMSCRCTAAGIWDFAVKSTVCNRGRSAVPAWSQVTVTRRLISPEPFKCHLMAEEGLLAVSSWVWEMFKYVMNYQLSRWWNPVSCWLSVTMVISSESQ